MRGPLPALARRRSHHWPLRVFSTCRQLPGSELRWGRGLLPDGRRLRTGQADRVRAELFGFKGETNRRAFIQNLDARFLERSYEVRRVTPCRFFEDHPDTIFRLDAQLGPDGEVHAEGVVGQGTYLLYFFVQGAGRSEAVCREKA